MAGDTVGTCGASSVITLKVQCEHMDNEDINNYVKNNSLILANGKSLRLVMNACQQNPGKDNMPIKQGFVGSYRVIALRDTGCSSAIVKKQFVTEDQYTGMHSICHMIK